MTRGQRTAHRAELAADGRPVRSCVACRTRRPQDELVRVTVDGAALTVDARNGPSRRQGRGAYLCVDATCVARALERNALLLRRALRSRVALTIPEELERVGLPAI
jgi:predicted RNA-binding protein YlxR (DUF448 family)